MNVADLMLVTPYVETQLRKPETLKAMAKAAHWPEPIVLPEVLAWDFQPSISSSTFRLPELKLDKRTSFWFDVQVFNGATVPHKFDEFRGKAVPTIGLWRVWFGVDNPAWMRKSVNSVSGHCVYKRLPGSFADLVLLPPVAQAA